MTGTSYLSLLTREIEEIMDKYVERTGRLPRTVWMPRSSYLVLQDYCIAYEQEIYVQLLLQRIQAKGAAQGQVDAKIRRSRTRREQLTVEGVHSLSCKYGSIPIEIHPELEEIEIQ